MCVCECFEVILFLILTVFLFLLLLFVLFLSLSTADGFCAFGPPYYILISKRICHKPYGNKQFYKEVFA